MATANNDEPVSGPDNAASVFFLSLSLLPLLVLIVSFLGAEDGFQMMRMTFGMAMIAAILTAFSGLPMRFMKDQKGYRLAITTVFLSVLCLNFSQDPTLSGYFQYGEVFLSAAYVALVLIVVGGGVSASKRPHVYVENIYHRSLMIQVALIPMVAVPFALFKHYFSFRLFLS